MRVARSTAVAAIIAIALTACTPGELGTEEGGSLPNSVEQSDSLLARVIPDDGPGCAGAVSIDGSIAWAGESGLADLDTGRAITADTRFDIASVSKQFTGLAVLRLVESGELNLDDTVGAYLDGMPAWDETVTIEQLLHHTSGIIDYTELLLDEGFDFSDTTLQQDALDVIANTELASAPGDQFSYSNSNYVLLASIVEEATGTDFATVLALETFGDEAMRLEPASTAPDVARSYEDREDAQSAWEQIGDGSIVATASEVARWGSIYAETTDAVVRAMTERAVTDNEEGGLYGAGIEIDSAGALGHSGAWAGFISLFWVSPDRSTVIAINCNSDDHDIDEIAQGLLAVWW